MKFVAAIAFAGALTTAPAIASPLDVIQAGGTLGASTGFSLPQPILVGPPPSAGNFQAVSLDYKGVLNAVIDVSEISNDPSQNFLNFAPSLHVIIDGHGGPFVEFLQLFNGDSPTASLGENEITWPFELRTQIDPAPGQVTLSAVLTTSVRGNCCTIESTFAAANGFATVSFTDPPAGVPEPGSWALLLGAVGLFSLTRVTRRAATITT